MAFTQSEVILCLFTQLRFQHSLNASMKNKPFSKNTRWIELED